MRVSYVYYVPVTVAMVHYCVCKMHNNISVVDSYCGGYNLQCSYIYTVQ